MCLARDGTHRQELAVACQNQPQVPTQQLAPGPRQDGEHRGEHYGCKKAPQGRHLLAPRVSHHDSGHPEGFKTPRIGETMASRPASKVSSASKGTTKRLSAPVRDTKTDLAGFARERLILVWPWPLSRAMPDLNNELYWSRSLSSLKPPFLPPKMCAPDALSYFPNGFSPTLGE